MRKILFISLLCLPAMTWASAKTDALLKDTTARYRKSPLVEMEVEKSVKSELLPSTTYNGKISLSAGKFRLETTSPDKALLVFDGITLWNEQAPSADFPGPVQVTKQKIGSKNRALVIFASLLGQEPLTQHFKIISSKTEGDQKIYEAEPLQSDLNVKKLILSIQQKKKEVSEISYTDDVDNVTTMKFSKTQFLKKSNKKLFDYKPPKGAQVTTL